MSSFDEAAKMATKVATITFDALGATTAEEAEMASDIKTLHELAHAYRDVWDGCVSEQAALTSAERVVNLFIEVTYARTYARAPRRGAKAVFAGRTLAIMVVTSEDAVNLAACIRSRSCPRLDPARTREHRTRFRNTMARLARSVLASAENASMWRTMKATAATVAGDKDALIARVGVITGMLQRNVAAVDAEEDAAMSPQ